MQSRVQGSEPLLWLLRFMRWDQICTRWSWGILCKYLVSWLRVGALEGCQGSALPGGNAFYAMCYLCFVCVCRSAWVYGVCVTVLSLCLVYSVQPFFQYISVPEFPSCLLISSYYADSLILMHNLWNQTSHTSQHMACCPKSTMDWQQPHGKTDLYDGLGPGLICISPHQKKWKKTKRGPRTWPWIFYLTEGETPIL